MQTAIIERDGSVRVVPLLEWGQWFEKANHLAHYSEGGRVVQKTELPDGTEVSTVFLGVNHRFMRCGSPLWFETMIFGGNHDGYQERHSTFEEAETGHRKAVEVAKGESSDD